MDSKICKGAPAYWMVTDVKARNDYTLILTFQNGKRKIYNALPLLEEKIYAPLKDLAFFLTVKVSGDSIAWNDEIDIAPEHLYECSKEIS